MVKFAHAKLGGVVPDYTKYVDESGSFAAFEKDVNEHLATYIKDLKATKLRAGLSTILAISALGNKLLQDNKLGNQLAADEPDRCAAVVGLALNLLHLLANLASPYMPGTAESILAQLGFSPDADGKYPAAHIPDLWTADLVPAGQKLGEPKLLFSAIPAAKLDEWRETFGGEELRLQKAAEAEKAAAKKAAKEREKEKKRLKKLAAAQAAGAGAGEKKGEEGAAKGPAVGETPLVHRDKA